MGGLFGGRPKMPDPEPPKPMPDEEQLTAARRRRIASERNRSGMASTILSDGGRETLGG